MSPTYSPIQFYCIILLSFISVSPIFAQLNDHGLVLRENFVNQAQTSNDDPTHYSIYTLKDLCWGTFFPGNNGGTISILPSGIRSVEGGIIPLFSDLPVSTAMFEIKCSNHTMINIVCDDHFYITNQFGRSLLCEPIIANDQPLVSPSTATSGFVYPIGAKLHVPALSATDCGEFTGKFNVTLVFE